MYIRMGVALDALWWYLFRSGYTQDHWVLLADDDLIFDANAEVVEVLGEQSSRRNVDA